MSDYKIVRVFLKVLVLLLLISNLIVSICHCVSLNAFVSCAVYTLQQEFAIYYFCTSFIIIVPLLFDFFYFLIHKIIVYRRYKRVLEFRRLRKIYCCSSFYNKNSVLCRSCPYEEEI